MEDLVRYLIYTADDDLDLAQYGIIYLNEVDKIVSSNTLWSEPDVSHTGGQLALLKLTEESETAKYLIKSGFESEFVGRLPVIAVFG